MRYAILGALILSLEAFGVSVAGAAMPANGQLIVKASSSRDVIQVGGGCGAKFWRNKQTGKCEGKELTTTAGSFVILSAVDASRVS
jgi:hypothetical protein